MTRKHNMRASSDLDDARKKRVEGDAFEALRLRLQDAFSVADGEYELVSADDIRRRVRVGAERLGLD